jgi:hypothetical protein
MKANRKTGGRGGLSRVRATIGFDNEPKKAMLNSNATYVKDN